MNRKSTPINNLKTEKLKLLMGISLGIFLFILFFQPFSLESLDFNNRLLFVAGLAGIIFFFLLGVQAAAELIIRKNYPDLDESASYLSDFIFLCLSTVAFTFYLRYVGSVTVSFYLVFKVALVCVAAPLFLRLYDNMQRVKEQNALLLAEKRKLQTQIEQFQEVGLAKTIEFISDTISENLNLQLSDVVFVKSADNYVEVVYREEEGFRKSLIRNTLKNIELQLKAYEAFTRCHRTCIVNIQYIEKLNRSYGNHWLSIKGYSEKLPVSRQYLLRLKELV